LAAAYTRPWHANFMKAFLLIILTGLFFFNASGQVLFSPVESKLKAIKSNNLTELTCSSSTMSVKFRLKRNVTVLQQKNFVTVENQTIQIIPLKFSGYKNSTSRQGINSEKQLLNTYSNYELEYLKNELGVDVKNPNSQWIVTKSKGWLIWYFKVGNMPPQLDKQTSIQLFASTVIGDKILTVNAPIYSNGDFNKAGLIVNEMIETLVITKQ
jgi:hypothetical protein